MEKNSKIKLKESDTRKSDVTFRQAKLEAIHRWFPYLEGFSEKFIDDIITGLKNVPNTIYEPFAGSGTLPVYSVTRGIKTFYSEINPFLQDLIQTKIDLLQTNEAMRQKIIGQIKDIIKELDVIHNYEKNLDLEAAYKEVFHNSVYFSESNIDTILRVKTLIQNITNKLTRDLVNIAACESLLHSSYLKRAGDIRFKKISEHHQIEDFRHRTHNNLNKIIEDIAGLGCVDKETDYHFIPNAKEFEESFENQIDVVVTSPPYLNGTNYIRNTKLELWFLGYLKVKKDLGYYRRLVVTSGINDVGREIKKIEIPSLTSKLSDPQLWYDKRIPKMINDYFYDMDLTFKNMYRYMKKGSLAFIDIGDSIYGGIHIPTDEILIDLLIRNKFEYKDNILLRTRKSKSGELIKQTLIVVEK